MASSQIFQRQRERFVLIFIKVPLRSEDSPQSEFLVLLCSVEMLRIIAICKRPMNIT